MEKRIAGGIDGIFPFLGARCEDLTDRVLARLERGD
jgi:hypothetical protein